MLSWLFKRNNDVSQIHSRLDQNFSRVREDMNAIGKWVHHFKSKHDDHDKMFKIIMKRLNSIEAQLEGLSQNDGKEISGSEEEEEDELPSTLTLGKTSWDSLTDTHQKICLQIAAVQKELPNQWISLKYLAQEMYPDKGYNQVRSTLSQYISGLEDLGYVKRMRKGKQAYVFSTAKNPCLKEKKKVAEKARSK